MIPHLINRFIPIALLLLFPAGQLLAAPGIPAISVEPGENGETYTLSLQALALMTALTLLPSGLMMMTSFTRIIISLSILRTALGTG